MTARTRRASPPRKAPKPVRRKPRNTLHKMIMREAVACSGRKNDIAPVGGRHGS